MPIQKQRLAEIQFRPAPNRLIGELFSGHTLGAAEVTVRLVEMSPASEQQPRHPHWHEGFEEVIHFLAGNGRTWANGHWIEVQAGDTILIPPGLPHATFNVGDEPLRLLCFFPRAEIEPFAFGSQVVTLESKEGKV